mmetsp:Transcript_16371/g.35393  ORF Transcript_16371/g.35393 Transcript_16371/m.35393 type:complete len:242 (+) Transcript_16371:2-727(+)
MEEEEEEEEEEAPSKVVKSDVQVTVQAAIRYFDYEGRGDSGVMKQVLQELAPRQVVLLRGSREECAELRGHCERELSDFKTRVLVPGPQEEADLSLPPCHTLQLSDDLLGRLHMAVMRSSALVALSAGLGPPDPHHPDLLQLVPCPAPGGDALHPHIHPQEGQDVFIADHIDGVKLTHIKAKLADAGLASTFHGTSSLLCGSVIISKGGDKAHLLLEGALCEEYYRVRDVIYAQYSATSVN